MRWKGSGTGSYACETDAGWNVVKHRAFAQVQLIGSSHWAQLLDTPFIPDRLKEIRKHWRAR